MQIDFEVNLAKVLAFSVVYEARKLDPWDVFRNDEHPGVNLLSNAAPKDDPKATSPQKAAQQIASAFALALPQILNTYNTTLPQTESSLLASEQAVAPGYAQLSRELFGKNLESVVQSSANAARVSNELGRDLDPEFFALRSGAGNVGEAAANALVGSLTNPLTRGEEVSIERNLNRLNQASGLSDTPSSTSTVANAAVFGEAARNRLNQALDRASQFLPSSAGFLQAARTAPDLTQQTNLAAALSPVQRPQPGVLSSAITNTFLGGTQQQQLSNQELDATRRRAIEIFASNLPNY